MYAVKNRDGYKSRKMMTKTRREKSIGGKTYSFFFKKSPEKPRESFRALVFSEETFNSTENIQFVGVFRTSSETRVLYCRCLNFLTDFMNSPNFEVSYLQTHDRKRSDNILKKDLAKIQNVFDFSLFQRNYHENTYFYLLSLFFYLLKYYFDSTANGVLVSERLSNRYMNMKLIAHFTSRNNNYKIIILFAKN